MKKKELFFKSAEIVESKSVKTLKLHSYNNGELSVNDGEIVENEDSAEVVVFTHDDAAENESVVLIHKKDILPLASFLLEIYNNYADRQEKILFEEYSKHVRLQAEREKDKEMNK